MAANLVALVQEAMDLDESALAPYSYLFTAVQRFQHRNLTDEDDAINAMMGILHRVAQKGQHRRPRGSSGRSIPIDLELLASKK